MKVTIDANVLFSALIKNADTRKVITNPELTIYAPAFIFTELLKYKKLILKKSKGKEEDLDYLIAILLKNVKIIGDEEILPFVPAAQTLTSDTKDVLYFACALYKDTAIWTNDKEFKNQSRVKVYTIKEIIKEFGHL